MSSQAQDSNLRVLHSSPVKKGQAAGKFRASGSHKGAPPAGVKLPAFPKKASDVLSPAFKKQAVSLRHNLPSVSSPKLTAAAKPKAGGSSGVEKLRHLQSEQYADNGQLTRGFESPTNGTTIQEVAKDEVKRFISSARSGHRQDEPRDQQICKKNQEKRVVDYDDSDDEYGPARNLSSPLPTDALSIRISRSRPDEDDDDVQKGTPDQTPQKRNAAYSDVGGRAVEHVSASITDEQFAAFTRDIAARVIQSHWSRWKDWKLKMRKEAEQRTLRQFLGPGIMDHKHSDAHAAQGTYFQHQHQQQQPPGEHKSSGRVRSIQAQRQNGGSDDAHAGGVDVQAMISRVGHVRKQDEEDDDNGDDDDGNDGVDQHHGAHVLPHQSHPGGHSIYTFAPNPRSRPQTTHSQHFPGASAAAVDARPSTAGPTRAPPGRATHSMSRSMQQQHPGEQQHQRPQQRQKCSKDDNDKDGTAQQQPSVLARLIGCSQESFSSQDLTLLLRAMKRSHVMPEGTYVPPERVCTDAAETPEGMQSGNDTMVRNSASVPQQQHTDHSRAWQQRSPANSFDNCNNDGSMQQPDPCSTAHGETVSSTAAVGSDVLAEPLQAEASSHSIVSSHSLRSCIQPAALSQQQPLTALQHPTLVTERLAQEASASSSITLSRRSSAGGANHNPNQHHAAPAPVVHSNAACAPAQHRTSSTSLQMHQAMPNPLQAHHHHYRCEERNEYKEPEVRPTRQRAASAKDQLASQSAASGMPMEAHPSRARSSSAGGTQNLYGSRGTGSSSSAPVLAGPIPSATPLKVSSRADALQRLKQQQGLAGPSRSLLASAPAASASATTASAANATGNQSTLPAPRANDMAATATPAAAVGAVVVVSKRDSVSTQSYQSVPHKHLAHEEASPQMHHQHQQHHSTHNHHQPTNTNSNPNQRLRTNTHIAGATQRPSSSGAGMQPTAASTPVVDISAARNANMLAGMSAAPSQPALPKTRIAVDGGFADMLGRPSVRPRTAAAAMTSLPSRNAVNAEAAAAVEEYASSSCSISNRQAQEQRHLRASRPMSAHARLYGSDQHEEDGDDDYDYEEHQSYRQVGELNLNPRSASIGGVSGAHQQGLNHLIQSEHQHQQRKASCPESDECVAENDAQGLHNESSMTDHRQSQAAPHSLTHELASAHAPSRDRPYTQDGVLEQRPQQQHNAALALAAAAVPEPRPRPRSQSSAILQTLSQQGSGHQEAVSGVSRAVVGASLTAEKMTSILSYLDEAEAQAEQEASAVLSAPPMLLHESSFATTSATSVHHRRRTTSSTLPSRPITTAASVPLTSHQHQPPHLQPVQRRTSAHSLQLHASAPSTSRAASVTPDEGRVHKQHHAYGHHQHSTHYDVDQNLDHHATYDNNDDDNKSTAGSMEGVSVFSGKSGLASTVGGGGGGSRSALLAESVYEGVRAKMKRLQEDVRERDADIASLQQEVARLQQAQRASAADSDARLHDMLAAQRVEYEAAVSRHLALVDRLLADKDSLGAKASELAESLKASDERHERTLAKLKEGWAAELKRQREAWGVAEKLKREQWLQAKTQEIKDITVKGLEAEVQKLLARHKAELGAAQQGASEEARRQLDAYVVQSEAASRALRERLAKEAEEVVDRERQAAAQRLREASERYESQLQTQRMRLVADADLRLEQLEQTRKEERKRYEEALSRVGEGADVRLKEAEEEFKREREALRKAHDKQIETLRDQYETGQEGWRAAMAERARKEVAERTAAIKDKLLQERNEEIQAVVLRLEAEHCSARDDLQAQWRRREEEMAAKHSAALKEARRSEAKYADRFRSAGLAQQQAEEKVATLDMQLTDLRREVDAKNSTIRWLESQVSGAKDEAVLRERDLRSVVAQKEAVQADAVSAVQRDKQLLEGRLMQAVQEHQDMRSKHAAEMSHVEARIKATLAKKDESAQALRDQVAALQSELRSTQLILAQQREELEDYSD